MIIQYSRDGGHIIDGATFVPIGHRLWTEAERRAALPPGHPEHIDILPADPPLPPPTADEKLAAWKANPVNAAVLSLLAADSRRTDAQIDAAIKARL